MLNLTPDAHFPQLFSLKSCSGIRTSTLHTEHQSPSVYSTSLGQPKEGSKYPSLFKDTQSWQDLQIEAMTLMAHSLALEQQLPLNLVVNCCKEISLRNAATVAREFDGDLLQQLQINLIAIHCNNCKGIQ